MLCPKLLISSVENVQQLQCVPTATTPIANLCFGIKKLPWCSRPGAETPFNRLPKYLFTIYDSILKCNVN